MGDIHLGKPLPRRYLLKKSRLELRYYVRLVADAQPFEGFRLANPNIIVSVGDGPFKRWMDAWWKSHGTAGPQSAPKPPKAQLALQAVKRWRAGAKIKSILILSPTLKTRKGIGVGSTLAEVEQAYGSCDLRGFPPELGQDECQVHNNFLPARFYFATCAKARKGGRVTKIKLW